MVNHNSEFLMVFNGPKVTLTSIGEVVVGGGCIADEVDNGSIVVCPGIVIFSDTGGEIGRVQPDEHAKVTMIRKQKKEKNFIRGFCKA
jgi:hypothetical protein